MRVLVADDHSIVRSALRHLLAEIDESVTVAEARTFDDIADVLSADGAGFDLVIVDLRMPGFGGPEDLQALVGRLDPVPVAVFSMVDSPDEMRSVIACGIRAFIPKSTEDGVVVGILRLVLAGGTYVPPVLGGLPPSTPSAGGGEGGENLALFGLTPRQMEVLRLMAEGLSNGEICERLGLNLSTVKSHVTAILRGAGAANRTRAVLAYKEAVRARS